MSTADEFKKWRELADRCRSCDPFGNPEEAASLLKLLAAFLDKLIAQKESERETSRKSDTENLTAAITDLTGIIGVLAERVGNAAPKAKSPAKKSENFNTELYSQIVDAYNSNCGSLPKVAKLTEERKRAIRVCVERGYTLDDFRGAVKKASLNSFLNGNGDRKFRANFDFIIKPNNLQKIIEDAYGSMQEDSHSYNAALLLEHAYNTTPKIN